MPRKPKAIKRPPGNPQKPIDWDIVEKMAMSGCFGTEIAASFGIHEDTLYNRCETEYGIGWSAYLAYKKATGRAIA